jgi:hypothetical protein
VGYEVHITRKNNWFGDDGLSISCDEWLQYVLNDPEMRADGYAEAPLPDHSTLRIDHPSIAVWTTYSGHGVSGNMVWFMHFEDRITVKNPDEEILVKMYQIASALNAKVQGDDGEEYGADGEPHAECWLHSFRDMAVGSRSTPSV